MISQFHTYVIPTMRGEHNRKQHVAPFHITLPETYQTYPAGKLVNKESSLNDFAHVPSEGAPRLPLSPPQFERNSQTETVSEGSRVSSSSMWVRSEILIFKSSGATRKLEIRKSEKSTCQGVIRPAKCKVISPC